MLRTFPAARPTAATLVRLAGLALIACLLWAPGAQAAGRSTATSVSCSPSELVVVGVPATCFVVVTDTAGGAASTPDGQVTFASTGAGPFTNEGTCTLSSGACAAVAYRPAATGAQTITVTYAGDATHDLSVGTTTLHPAARDARAALSCPIFVDLGATVTCSATVYDDTSAGLPGTPTGTVTFKSSLAGTYDNDTCTLVAQACSVTFTPSALGTHTFTATYSGDATHTAAAVIQGTAVMSRTASAGFTMTCAPATLAAGGATTCTGVSTNPAYESGLVSFTTTGAGVFAPTGACTLVALRCSVTYTPAVAGAQTVSAQLMRLPQPLLTAASDLDVTAAAAPGGGGTPTTPTAPGKTASLSATRVQKVVRRSLRATCVTTSSPIRKCVVTLKRRGSTTVLGRGTATAKGSARRLTVTVRLTAAGRKLLARSRSAVALQLSATVTPATGKATTVSAPVSVKR